MKLAPSQPTNGHRMTPADLTNFDQLPNAAFVDVHVVAGLFGCKVPTIWARLRRKELIPPKKFGAHTRWNVGELRAALGSTEPTSSAAATKTLHR